MQVRAPLSIALGLSLVSFPLGAQQFRYAPGSARYEAEVVTQMTRDIGGQRVEEEINQRQRLTVALAAAMGDTLRIGVTIDSAAVATRSSGPQDVSPLVGLRIDGRISTLGALYTSGVSGRDIGPTGVMVASELARFLPKMRADLRMGLTWTDTTSERIDMLGIPVDRRVITTSHVRGDTTLSAGRGWKIDRKSTVDFSGGGTMGGQQVQLTGASTADGVVVISHAGRYLASTQTDSVSTKFTIPSRGMEVGMTQSQVARVRLVP